MLLRAVLHEPPRVEDDDDRFLGEPEPRTNSSTQAIERLAKSAVDTAPASSTRGTAMFRPGRPVAGSGRKFPIAKSSVWRARLKDVRSRALQAVS